MCADMLVELARREREAGIFPEKDVDVYMKAIAVEGQEHSLVTDYIMKVTTETASQCGCAQVECAIPSLNWASAHENYDPSMMLSLEAASSPFMDQR